MIARSETNRTSLALAMALAAGLAALLGMALVTLPLPTVGIMLAAVLVVVLAVFNQVLALYAIALAAALSPGISLGVQVRVDDLLMSVFASAWLLRKVTFGDRKGSALDRILLAYLLVAFASILWGTYLGTAHYTLDKLSSAPFHFLKRAEFVFLFFVIVDTLRTADDVKRFTYVMIAALVALSTYSLIEYLQTGGAGIALSPPGAPVHEPGWASLLNIALCLSLLPAASRSGKVLLSAVVCLSLAVLPLTIGRNFMASTYFIILYVGLVQQRWLLLFLPVPVLMWLITLPERFVNRILTFQHVFALDTTGQVAQGAALISRVIYPLQYAILALGYSPLLGFGLGSTPLGAIDSEYSTQIFYTGFIGFAIFLMMGARLFRMVRETREAATTPLVAALANSYQLILLAYAFYSMLAASISAQRPGTFFFIAIGMIAALHRSVTEPASEDQRAIERPRPALMTLAR
jgi:hypothetical protein